MINLVKRFVCTICYHPSINIPTSYDEINLMVISCKTYGETIVIAKVINIATTY